MVSQPFVVYLSIRISLFEPYAFLYTFLLHLLVVFVAWTFLGFLALFLATHAGHLRFLYIHILYSL